METGNLEQISRVINTLFLKIPVEMVLPDKSVPVRIVEYSNSLLEIECNIPSPEIKVLQIRHKNFEMDLECKFIEKKDGGTEMVRPIRLKVVEKARKEERYSVAKTPGTSDAAYTISNVVDLNHFTKKLSSIESKRDAIIGFYKKAITERMPEGTRLDIVLRKTARLDPRMRAMIQAKKSIFCPHRRDQQYVARMNPTKFIPYADYKNILNYEESNPSIVGEICESIWYRGIYMYAYFQALSTAILEETHCNIMEKLSRSMEQDLEKHDCLPKSNVKCPMDDMSLSGISFLYPHSAGIYSSFMPGDSVVFDIQMEDDNKTAIVGIVRNIKSLEKHLRFGVEFSGLTPEQSEFIAHYVNRVKGKVT